MATDLNTDITDLKGPPYKVPEELIEAYYKENGLADPKGRPGDLLKYSLQHVYGVKGYQSEISSYLRVVRQTVFQWIKTGIPEERLRGGRGALTFRSFVEARNTRFYIASNVALDDFKRPQPPRRSVREHPERSEALLQLLFRIVASQGAGQISAATLDNLAEDMKNVTSPHLFWKWAYLDGGIPVTYIETWRREVAARGAHRVLDEQYHDEEAFARHVRRTMCEDADYHDRFYGLKKDSNMYYPLDALDIAMPE